MESFIDLLAAMPFWAWFVLAGVLLLGEIVTGTSYLLWPAVAALIVGLLTIGQLEGRWATQWILFAVITVGITYFGKPYAEQFINASPTDKPTLNEGQRILGKQGVVISDFSAGVGRVRLGDTDWSARTETGVSLTEGTSVKVVNSQGTVLIVDKIA